MHSQLKSVQFTVGAKSTRMARVLRTSQQSHRQCWLVPDGFTSTPCRPFLATAAIPSLPRRLVAEVTMAADT